jgi:hypothetical protein
MTERDLEATLRDRYAARAERPMPPAMRELILAVPAQELARQRVERAARPRWARSRSTLLLAAMLVVAGTAAVLAGALRASPAPVDFGAYQAVLLRPVPGTSDLDVVLVRADGQERPLRRIDHTVVSDTAVLGGYGVVSPEGWLAVSVTDTGAAATPSLGSSYFFSLLDLRDADRPPRTVPYAPVIGGRWGPGGLFATTCPGRDPGSCGLDGWSLQVVDATSGVRRLLGGLALPGGGPSLIWAADGSGLLVDPDGRNWAIAPLDGSAPVPGVPALYPGPSHRWVAEGGAVLESSGVATAADGTRTRWYDGELDPSTLLDASFSSDGRSVWLLLARTDGGRHEAVLAHAAAPGEAQLVAAAEVGAGWTLGGISAMAPDDSIAGVLYDAGPDVAVPVTLVPTIGFPATAHDGTLVGFVPSSLADTWTGADPFRPGAAASFPTMAPTR